METSLPLSRPAVSAAKPARARRGHGDAAQIAPLKILQGSASPWVTRLTPRVVSTTSQICVDLEEVSAIWPGACR
jgi:hypothetical protein